MIPKRYTEFYGDNTRWFIGVVKNINDPLELGRVQVKIFGIHEGTKEDIPDADLPYAQVVMPITEGGVKGLGNTVGLQVNARVFGIFLDGKHSQDPLVLGSLPKIEEESDGAITDVTTSQLARGTNTLSKSNDSIIDETPYDNRYKAAYPNNAVHQTSSGHVIEVDDTSGYERIHIFHKSGTFVEMHSNGDVVTQHKNGFRTVTGNDKLHVTENLDIVVGGNCNFSVQGNINMTSIENINMYAAGQIDIEGTQLDLNLTGGNVDGLEFAGETVPNRATAGGSKTVPVDENGDPVEFAGSDQGGAVVGVGRGSVDVQSAIDASISGSPTKCARADLGELSQKYESRGRVDAVGVERHVVNGVETHTSESWGFHQISTDKGVNRDKTSSMDRFMTFLKDNPIYESQGLHSELTAAGGALAAIDGKNGAFGNTWRKLGKRSIFQDAQKEFIRRSHYDTAVNQIQLATGIDVCDGAMSNGVQEALFSTAVQHGPGIYKDKNGKLVNNGATGVFQKALSRTGKWNATTKKYTGTQQELIDAIYDERSKSIDGDAFVPGTGDTLAYFRGNKMASHDNLYNRLITEKAENKNFDQVEQEVVNQASWFNIGSAI